MKEIWKDTKVLFRDIKKTWFTPGLEHSLIGSEIPKNYSVNDCKYIFMKEIWKDIKNYEGLYQVSNFGRVKSLKFGKEKILKLLKHNCGYLYIGLHKDNNVKNYYIHRLVAEAFIPNPDNLPQVNHKDENKLNNVVSNLEWCDAKYNINYGTARERSSEKMINGKLSKKVFQYDLEGNFIREWESVNETGRNGFDSSAIAKCCKDIIKTYKGFKWSYSLYYESKTNSD